MFIQSKDGPLKRQRSLGNANQKKIKKPEKYSFKSYLICKHEERIQKGCNTTQ